MSSTARQPSLPQVRPTSEFSEFEAKQAQEAEGPDPDLESSVAAKRSNVEQQAAELKQLEDRIAAADAREAALKKALGV
ncbi:hypothetical protein RQP46_006867 [Phenoliferia psychrophenolica]